MDSQVVIRVCMGPAGIAAGGKAVLDAFEHSLSDAGIKAQLRENCSSHQVGCVGLCARDVLVEIHEGEKKTVYQYVKPDMVSRIIQEHLVGGKPVEEWLVGEVYDTFYGKQTKIVLSDCGRIDPEDIEAYLAVGGYEAIRKALHSMVPEQVVEEIKKSGLRGRGGAGFSTGIKWAICADSESKVKYIICNADEGDPGAFMDRAVIEGNPHAVIEGMMIGAYGIGAHEGYVYIRAEYPLAVDRLKLAIQQARAKGILGKSVLGSHFDFDIKIKLGAGAFVCGEETALIASIEGERGIPRSKPPFPVFKGLWGKPTVINNVETLANVPYILRKGAKWFASLGSEKSKGTKVFALTGKIKNTGLIEVPMGIPLREIIYEIGGGIDRSRAFKAVQTGGPSGGCIPAEHIDLPVDYENLIRVGSMMGSGGMVVLDETDCMVNIAKFFLEFTQSESCGKCTPCRFGTKRLLEILTRITKGQGLPDDIERLERMAKTIKDSSLCGLGMSAPNPVLSTLRYFRHEYEAHIHERRCPAGVCRDLITFSIDAEKCTGCGKCRRNCPVEAIEGAPKVPHRILAEKCVKCGNCFEVCPEKFSAVMKK